MNFVAVAPVSRTARPSRVNTRKTPVREELFTLYRKGGSNEGYYAKSIQTAILMAKRKLEIPFTASEQRFRAAGGEYVLQNSTGNRVYPAVKH